MQVAVRFSWGGKEVFYSSFQVKFGPFKGGFLSNCWCVKHVKDEASHVCAVYVRVCEKGRLFLCFIVFLTNLLCRLKRLLSRATKKLRAYEEKEMESQLNLQGEMKNRYSEMVNEVGRLRTKVSSGLFGVFWWWCFFF